MSPDSKLVQRLLSGDPFAGREFVERFGRHIYSILVRQWGISENQRGDAFQYVFLKLFEDDCRRLRAWRAESALITYLFAVTRSLGRDFREKELDRNRRLAQHSEDNLTGLTDAEAPTPEDEILVSCMEVVIGDLVNSLEDICRKVIEMRFWRRMSHKEVALAAGIKVDSVGVRLHRCLDTLTQLMKREFPNLFEDRFNLDM